jgi:Ca-activated chloride channel family protein
MPTDPESALHLTAVLDRSLAWHSGSSVRHLVATVTAADAAPAVAAATKKHLNLALVIDTSGSMSGAKLDAARQAVIRIAEGLGGDDRLSVVSFADDAVVHVDGLAMDRLGSQRCALAVSGIEPRGRTNLADGWLRGAECVAGLMEQMPGTTLHRVVVLSDGMANQGIRDPAVLQQHADELRRRGLHTSTVGIGDDYESTLLQAIAEHGGGRMHDAERPDEIAEVLLGELRESREVAVENVMLSIDVPARAQVQPYGGFPVETGRGTLDVLIGSLLPVASRTVVFKVTCPAGEIGETIDLVVNASGMTPGAGGEPGTAPETIASIRLVEGRVNSGQPRDETAMLAVARAWQLHALRAVTRLNRKGELREGHAYLGRELKFFERYCEGIEACRPLVAEMVRVYRASDRSWDERTRKEVELHAYKGTYAMRDLRSGARRSWVDRLKE